MCGICGIVHRDGGPVDPLVIERMSSMLVHRGPDGSGAHVSGPVGLGHRRLSVIDLSDAGLQPMPNEDGRYWVVFNGEIYNSRELRRELVARGHTFRSQTDSEVILHLFEESGRGVLDRLNGMFAFAIWDAAERTLFAARDRFGIKPFYYAVTSDAFVFGSEIKALFASGLVAPALNPPALADYLTLQLVLGSKTLFRGCERLEPAHCLTVRDGVVRVDRYWDVDFEADMR